MGLHNGTMTPTFTGGCKTCADRKANRAAGVPQPRTPAMACPPGRVKVRVNEPTGAHRPGDLVCWPEGTASINVATGRLTYA